MIKQIGIFTFRMLNSKEECYSRHPIIEIVPKRHLLGPGTCIESRTRRGLLQ